MATLQKTRQLIVEHLKRSGTASVQQLSQELGLVAVTVRSHLSILERDGYIAGDEVRRGQAGRPHVDYRLTEKGEELFPRHYDRLANRLLDHLIAEDGADRVERILRAIAEDVAEEHVSRLAGRSFDERVAETTRILSDQGCTADYRQSAEGHHVSIYNCPYRKVMSEHPQVCTLEAHLLTTLTGGEVRALPDPQTRGAICSYTIVPAASLVPVARFRKS